MIYVLVPDERGHLHPTPEELAPGIRFYGEADMPNRYDEMFDDEPKPAAVCPPVADPGPSRASDQAPAALSAFAIQLAGLLQYRQDILDQAKGNVTRIDRDEVLEALATRRARLDRVGGSSCQGPDAFMADLLDSRIDLAFNTAEKDDRARSAQMEDARKVIRTADKLRHRLPLLLASLVDMVYYKGKTDEEAAQALGVALRRFNTLKIRALNDLADRVSMWA